MSLGQVLGGALGGLGMSGYTPDPLSLKPGEFKNYTHISKALVRTNQKKHERGKCWRCGYHTLVSRFCSSVCEKKYGSRMDSYDACMQQAMIDQQAALMNVNHTMRQSAPHMTVEEMFVQPESVPPTWWSLHKRRIYTALGLVLLFLKWQMYGVSV